MTEHLFIVARDQARLFEHLSREFAAEQKVRVILDRRQGDRRQVERRQSGAARGPDRRQGDRRAHSFIPSQLRSLGYALVRID